MEQDFCVFFLQLKWISLLGVKKKESKPFLLNLRIFHLIVEPDYFLVEKNKIMCGFNEIVRHAFFLDFIAVSNFLP